MFKEIVDHVIPLYQKLTLKQNLLSFTELIQSRPRGRILEYGRSKADNFLKSVRFGRAEAGVEWQKAVEVVSNR